MYLPLNYNQISGLACSYLPSSVKPVNNVHFSYWERSLFQRMLSVIDFELPQEWDKPKDFLLFCLFKIGFLGVVDVDKYGLVAQPCSLGGEFDLYYQPTKFIISNPKFNGAKTFEVGVDGEILKISPDYMGMFDIIDYYAERLALLDSSINMSLINSKFPWVLGAKNRSVAKTLQKAFDKAQRGEPLIIFDKKIVDDDMGNSPFQFIDLLMNKDRYLVPQQLQDFQTILNEFDTEIGIPTVPYQKKERMVESEADSKQIESVARLTTWINTFNNSAIEVNNHFGTNISAKMHFNDERGVNGEPIISDIN